VDREPLHAAGEGASVVGLADEVQVLSLEAELDEAEAEALSAGGDAFADHAKGAAVSQRGHDREEPDGDVGDVVAGDRSARAVRDA